MQQLELLPEPSVLRRRRRRVPETRCHVRVDGDIVAYLLSRSGRRSVSLTVDTDGLHVAAPAGAPIAGVEAFIRDNAKWVKRKLREWMRYRDTLPPPWRIGDDLPFLGEALRTRIEPGLVGARRVDNWLEIGLLPADAPRLWLKEQAQPLFAERIAYHAARMGVATPRLGLSNAQTRWGTCTETGRVTLNWRLVHFRLAVIDYVVVHELAHLIEMNHSRHFWALVGRQLPDYAVARAELRTRARQLPEI
jgi:predicted metal-dependent hydrolase